LASAARPDVPPPDAGSTAVAVLALCFVLALFGRGAHESFTVFLLPISTSFGWDRAEAVSIYSLAALSLGLGSPLVGRLFDRSGPRAVYGVGLLLIGGGFSLAAFAQALWQLQACLGVAVGLGAACLGNVSNALLLGRWFGRRLPTAMAIVFSAAGAGVVTLLPLSQVLIERTGWRSAYHLLGGAGLALAIPLLLLPWRRLAAGSGSGAAGASSTSRLAAGLTLSSALRHHAFWAIFSVYFFTAVGMFAISVQVVAYLVEAGFTAMQAATAWGTSGIVLVVGMLATSWMDGLLGRRRTILLSYGLSTSGIVMLWLLKSYPSAWLLAGFVACFGGTIGSRGPLVSAAAMTLFRGPQVGTIFGAVSLGSGLGSALGSWSGGLIHDWTGSYDGVIVFALVSVLAGMVPFLVVPALRR
jgi:MFS family permease